MFYVVGNDLTVVSIDVTQGAPRIEGSHRKIFSLDDFTVSVISGADFAVAPDGKRFLMTEGVAPGPEANQLHVVLDAFREFEPH